MGIRDEILSLNDLPLKEVNIKEWKMSVFVRGLTASERDKFESEMFDIKGKDVKMNRDNVRAKLVCLTACDKDGTRIFQDSDVVVVGKKSATAIDKLFSTAQKLSGLSGEDIEELTKNSETGLPV